MEDVRKKEEDDQIVVGASAKTSGLHSRRETSHVNNGRFYQFLGGHPRISEFNHSRLPH